jgi:hypothetical protein
MNIYQKLLTIIFLVIISTKVCAQEEVEETIIESTEVEEVYEATESNNRVISQGYYKFNQKYKLNSINDEYDWFYDKKSSYGSGRKHGIVDKKGEVILPNIFNYKYGGDSYNKIIYIDNNYGLFNLREKKWNIPLKYDYLESINNNFYSAKKHGVYKIIDFDNNVVSNDIWTSVKKISKVENYVIVSKKKNQETLYGVFSLLEKKIIIPCIYSSFNNLYNNDNYFQIQNKDTKNYNLITLNNNLVFKNWYNKIIVPSKTNNRFIVKKDKFYGVVDGNEKTIIPVTYLSISDRPYSDGSYLSQNKEGKYGFMTIDGTVTLPFTFDKLTKNYGSDNLISVKDSKCGMVKVNTGTPQEIISCNYDDINNFKKFFITKENNKYGLLDRYANVLVEPMYDGLELFNPKSNGGSLLKAKLKGKYFLLNEQGKTINQKKYKDIDIIIDESKSNSYSTYYTFLKVKEKKEYQIIDKIGKTISDAKFEDIKSEYKNIFIVKSKGKYGLYSLLNKTMLVDYKYDLITKTKQYFIGINNNKIDLLEYRQGKIKIKLKY